MPVVSIELTVSEVLERLRRAVARAGSQAAFARRHGMSTTYLNEVLRGGRRPGAPVLRALGVQRIERFVEEKSA